MRQAGLLLQLAILFYPFPGHAQKLDTMINVGNHRLHFSILKGTGTPILFESGNGDDSDVWTTILNPVYTATNATLITYDRAGLGKSEIDTATISFNQEILDLKTALTALGYTSDIFIVSHSFGGFYSTRFTTQYPRQIKGMVFIDVALPCFFTEEWSRNFTQNIAPEDWKLIKQHKAGLYFVLKNLAAIAREMKNQSVPDHLKVTLIAAENIPSMVNESEKRHWQECLTQFGALPNHSYILATGAGHKVWVDNPQIVIDEIVSLYNKTNVR